MSRHSCAAVTDFKTRVLRLKPEVQILGSSKRICHTKKFFPRNHVFFIRNKQNFRQIFERHFQMNYSVRIHDGFTLVCLHQCNDLHLAHKPQSSSARSAMPFVNQERLVLKFTNVLSPTVTKHVPLVRNISIHLYLYLYPCINFLFLFQVRSMFTMKKKE